MCLSRGGGARCPVRREGKSDAGADASREGLDGEEEIPIAEGDAEDTAVVEDELLVLGQEDGVAGVEVSFDDGLGGERHRGGGGRRVRSGSVCAGRRAE